MSQSAVSGVARRPGDSVRRAALRSCREATAVERLGRSLRPRAEGLWQSAEISTRRSRTTDAATVRVGATLTIGNYLVPPLIARFLRAHPGRPRRSTSRTPKRSYGGSRTSRSTWASSKASCHTTSCESHRGEATSSSSSALPAHPLATKRVAPRRRSALGVVDLRERGSGTRQAFDRAHARVSCPSCTSRSSFAHRGHQGRRRDGARPRLRLPHRARRLFQIEDPGAAARARQKLPATALRRPTSSQVHRHRAGEIPLDLRRERSMKGAPMKRARRRTRCVASAAPHQRRRRNTAPAPR